MDFIKSEIYRRWNGYAPIGPLERYVMSFDVHVSFLATNLHVHIRLAATLTFKELAIIAPTAFHSKTAFFSTQTNVGHGGSNEFFDQIFPVLLDPQPIVRPWPADALSQCLKILVEWHHASLAALLCQVYFGLMEGLEQQLPLQKKNKKSAASSKIDTSHHRALLVVACMMEYTRNFMMPRYDEVCEAVLAFCNHPKALIRLEVVRLIPRVAYHCPGIFGRRYLGLR